MTAAMVPLASAAALLGSFASLLCQQRRRGHVWDGLCGGQLRLLPVGEANYTAVLQLHVRPAQQEFVASNAYTVAQVRPQ